MKRHPLISVRRESIVNLVLLTGAREVKMARSFLTYLDSIWWDMYLVNELAQIYLLVTTIARAPFVPHGWCLPSSHAHRPGLPSGLRPQGSDPL